MSGITIRPNDDVLTQIDQLAERAADAPRTPGVLNEAELAQLPDDVRTIAARPSRSDTDQAFLTQVRDSLSPRSPAGPTIARRIATSGALTERQGFVGRTWQGIRDAFLSLIGRGDRIDSWWFNKDEIQATDRERSQAQVAALVEGMDASQRAEIMSPGFGSSLAQAMAADPEYQALNRDADDDAAMLHRVLRSHVQGLAEQEAAAQVESSPLAAPEARSAEAPARPGGTTHDLAELPSAVAEDPFFTNSSENFQLWYRGGWGTIDDRERRVQLERAAGLPTVEVDGESQTMRSVDGGTELNDENYATLYAHAVSELRALGFESLEDAFKAAQRALNVTDDGKPGGQTHSAFRDWAESNHPDQHWSTLSFVDLLRAQSE